MASEFVDPRMTSIKPRIRYNTIGGINGPLVVLDNVRCASAVYFQLEYSLFLNNGLDLTVCLRLNSLDTMKSSP